MLLGCKVILCFPRLVVVGVRRWVVISFSVLIWFVVERLWFCRLLALWDVVGLVTLVLVLLVCF